MILVQSCLPSPLLRSDRAFRLFAASARCAACCSFCFSRSSFSRLFRAAVPRNLLLLLAPDLLLGSSPDGSGDWLCFETVEDESEPVRCRLGFPF